MTTRPRRSLRDRILVFGSLGILLTVAALAVPLVLGARMHRNLSAATDAFVEEQAIANRVTQAVMRQFLVVSSVRSEGQEEMRGEFQAAGDLVYEQLRLYLFRDLTVQQRLQLETTKEKHQQLEVAAARTMELFARGDGEAGGKSFEAMSAHGFELLEAMAGFLEMREAELLRLRLEQDAGFRATYGVGAVFAAALVVGSVALLGFLQRRVEAPLAELTTVAHRIETGELDARVPEAHDQEFAALGASFNRMARALAGALEAARRSEASFRHLFTGNPLPMWVYDRETLGFLEVNDAAIARYGYSREELLTMGLPDIRPPEEVPRLLTNLSAERPALERSTGWRHRLKDGRIIDVEITSHVLEFAGRSAALVVALDVTERKRAEERIQKLNAELEARVAERTVALRASEEALRRYATELEATNQELEAFSYSVSHDLRAPLRSIHGFSQAVLERHEGLLEPQGVDDLRRVCAAAERMGALIDDLLQLSRATRAEMRREPLDLSRLAGRIGCELAESDRQRRVELRIADGLTGEGDQQLLALVLRNLMENAWKFTARRDRAVIEVGLTDGDDPSYFVRDNGAGFDMEYANKLFQPFQRLHSIRDFPGTGIGLALVQRIVHRHGGRVWAESAVDRGATFYFTLSAA